MKRLLTLTAAVVFLAACSQYTDDKPVTAEADVGTADLPPGITLVEEYDGTGDEIAIPYKKYRLDNGLTVVLHEDHSDPLVHVDVTYHVGSNREDPGRSGFAHFFEHMLFQGSENVGDDQHFKIVSNAGGSLNGTTNTDRTNYFQTVPANQLETVLWLEADRMGFLLPAVTQEKFEIQRETVKNERGQRVDNQPYGRALETLNKNLYPEGHPYSWPVIGWIEDLNRADLNDLKRFFLRWYGPNNAALTIGGDIDPMQTLEWVNKYFGSIPAGPDVEDLPKMPAEIESDRYVTLEDNIHLPALAMIVPTVHADHPDEPAIDAAAKILGQGQASLLYQRLVQTNRAVQANVFHNCKEIACELYFIVIQNPASGESLADMEQAVRDTMDEFVERGVSEDDLTKFKAEYEANRVFGLQSVSGKVSTLAAFETFTGSPKGVADEIDEYLAVETGDVVRVFDEYVAGAPAVILSIVPNGQTQLAAAEQNYDAGERDLSNMSDNDAELALRTPQDDFDRSVQPGAGEIDPVELPDVWQAELANGVPVMGVANEETPTVTINAVFDVGSRDEPAGKAGLTALMAGLMGEATESRSAAEFAEALDRIGANISVSSGDYETTVSLNVLSKQLDEGIALLSERILRPAFTQEDFDRLKAQTLEGLQQARKSPGPLADRAQGVVLFGPDHPLSYPTAGLPDTVGSLTRDDVVSYYYEHIPDSLMGVLVSADVSQSRVMAQLQPWGDLDVADVQRTALGGLPEIEDRTVYLVDKPEAAQSSIRVVHHALPYDAFDDYYQANLANFALGGNFSSRINLNLREDKGYTYGARSGFRGGPETGYFAVSTEVNRDATAASVKEILAELEQYDDAGMSGEEFAFTQSAIGQNDALQYETPGRKLGLLNSVLRYNLSPDYRQTQQEILENSTAAQLNRVVAENLDPQNVGIVVVGDVATIRSELEDLGYPIVELDADGNRI